MLRAAASPPLSAPLAALAWASPSPVLRPTLSCNLTFAGVGSVVAVFALRAGGGLVSSAAALGCFPETFSIRASLSATDWGSSTFLPLALKSTLPLSASLAAVILSKFPCVSAEP